VKRHAGPLASDRRPVTAAATKPAAGAAAAAGKEQPPSPAAGPTSSSPSPSQPQLVTGDVFCVDARRGCVVLRTQEHHTFQKADYTLVPLGALAAPPKVRGRQMGRRGREAWVMVAYGGRLRRSFAPRQHTHSFHVHRAPRTNTASLRHSPHPTPTPAGPGPVARHAARDRGGVPSGGDYAPDCRGGGAGAGATGHAGRHRRHPRGAARVRLHPQDVRVRGG
jgi:hypothetical protein